VTDLQAAFRSHQYWPTTQADYICSCGWQGQDPPKHVIGEVLLLQGLSSEWPHAKHRKLMEMPMANEPAQPKRQRLTIKIAVSEFKDKLAKLLGAYS